MKRLVVQEECIHGRTGDCDAQTHGLGRYCPGGSEERLDPATLSQIIHDLQDEYGHDTRHDIGLAILDALGKT